MEQKSTHYRWIVVAWAFIAIIITYMDRTALSYAIEPIEQTFGLSHTEFGILASAFGVGYILMTVVGGVIVDMWGARKIWSFFGVIWSLVSAALGFATGFWWLFAFRLLLGCAEGPSFPAFERVIADWLPMSERARAIAIGLAAVPLSTVIGAPLTSQLIAMVGWRAMFFILGLIGILWAFVWYAVFRDHPTQLKQVNEAELQHIFEVEDHATIKVIKKGETPWQQILFNRSLLTNNIGFLAFGYLLFFAINWLPGYLHQTFNMELKKIGWVLMLPWCVTAIFLLMGGILSDWIWKKTQSMRYARSNLTWVCQVLSAVCFLPMIFSHSLVICMVSLSLGMGFGMMPNSAFYALNADLAKEHAATSLGVMISVGSFSSILAPFLTGLLATITGSFSACILLMLVLTLLSALVIFIFQYPDDESSQ